MNHITTIINRIRKIYADSGDIKVLATIGIAPIPPIGGIRDSALCAIWEFDSIKEDILISDCA
ncbi:11892_t:CDS:1, partial [Entrophospora sp. SA101]